MDLMQWGKLPGAQNVILAFSKPIAACAFIALAACDGKAAPPVGNSDPSVGSRYGVNEPENCNYRVSIGESNTHDQLLDLMSVNKLQVCRWESRSEIHVIGMKSSSIDCNLANKHDLRVDTWMAKSGFGSERVCNVPAVREPAASEATNLEPFCFELESFGSFVPTTSDVAGAGSSLFLYLALPIRFVSASKQRGLLWADLQDYPWPDTFLEDSRQAVETTPWKLRIFRCP
jgi:hypothetical protein